MTKTWHAYALVLLGVISGVLSLLMWANVSWLNPFVCAMIATILPIAGAMVVSAK